MTAVSTVEGSLMQTLYQRSPARLSDKDLGRITKWLGFLSAAAFTFACAAVIWSLSAADIAA